MKKMMLFLLCISGQVVASPLAALEQAKQNLIAGRQKVTAGKEQVQAGYWKIKHEAVDPLVGAANGVQPTICMLTNIDKYAGDIVTAMGLLIASIVIVPPLGVAATIGTTLMVGVPEVVKAIKDVLNAVAGTVNNVSNTINTANEKMNPATLLAFANSVADVPGKINAIVQQSKTQMEPDRKLKIDFLNGVTNITAQLDKIINFVKSKADPLTGIFKPDAPDTSAAGVAAGNISGALGKLPMIGASKQAAPAARDKAIFDSYLVELSKAYAAIGAINYGPLVEVGKDKLGCPLMGTDPAAAQALDNAPGAAAKNDNNDRHPWAETRAAAVSIFDLLAQVNSVAWTTAGTQEMPVVYQQFTLAEQKFDLAIAKIDEIVTGFKAALAAAADDGS